MVDVTGEDDALDGLKDNALDANLVRRIPPPTHDGGLGMETHDQILVPTTASGVNECVLRVHHA